METTYQPRPTRYEEAAPYRRCGRSGVLLPPVSLGLWKNFGANMELAHCRHMVEHAFDSGITHFDLANNYGPPYGAAEQTFGHILRTSLAPYRDELFIATKAGYDMWPGPYGNWGSRKYLTASLDQSLKRMGLDYVDVFYSHRYDPNTPLEETLQTLVDLVRSGKALYAGISRWPRHAVETACRYLRNRDVPCLLYQGRLNLLDRSPLEEGTLALARDEGTGFVSFSPLAQGLLTNRYLDGIPDDSRMLKEPNLRPEVLTPTLLERLKTLNRLAAERGETLAQMALAWVLQQPGVTSVIVGASRVSQLNDSLSCTRAAAFTHEELLRIDQACTGL